MDRKLIHLQAKKPRSRATKKLTCFSFFLTMEPQEQVTWKDIAAREQFEEDLFLCFQYAVFFFGDEDIRVFPVATSDSGSAIIPFPDLVLPKKEKFTFSEILRLGNRGLPGPWSIIERKGAFQKILITIYENSFANPMDSLYLSKVLRAEKTKRDWFFLWESGTTADAVIREDLAAIAKDPTLLLRDVSKRTALVTALMVANRSYDPLERGKARNLIKKELMPELRKRLSIPLGSGRVATDLLYRLVKIGCYDHQNPNELPPNPDRYLDMRLKEVLGISLKTLKRT